jgi:flotillin
LGKAQAEIEQLKLTFEILEKSGESGVQAYIIENFQRLIEPFAETLSLFPVEQVSVVTGVEGSHEPISAIHPNAIAEEKNKLIAGALTAALEKKPSGSGKGKKKKPVSAGNTDESIQDLMIDLRDVEEITSIKED